MRDGTVVPRCALRPRDSAVKKKPRLVNCESRLCVVVATF